ncbi:MAG: EAL domain-containing protein [Lachnospiraceae bacterium]|nr:EAL domain-containing protein [Lachnospiraceae bacterium]
MDYNIHYDVAAVILAMAVLLHFLSKKSIRTVQRSLFALLLWLSFVSSVLDIITVYFNVMDMPLWFLYTINILYLALFNLLPYTYYHYLLSMVKSEKQRTWVDSLIAMVPMLPSLLLLITTPVTHWVIYYDSTGSYCHGTAFMFLYTNAFLYMLLSFILGIRYRKKYTRGQKISVYFYTVACLVGIVSQVLLPKVLLMQYVVAMALMLSYLSLANPENDEDRELGIYNRNGFVKTVNACIVKGRDFHVLGIRCNGISSLREQLGIENTRVLMKQMVERLETKLGHVRLYSITATQLAICAEEQAEDIPVLIDSIRESMQMTVEFHGMEIVLGVSIFHLEYPGSIETVEEILDVFESFGEHEREYQKEVLDGGIILQQMRRENKISQIMQRGLKNQMFEVYYQPIYSVEKKRFSSAEALIRLRDEELGYISPEEFIPLAEQSGMILQIGEFVFREVCRMLSEHKLWNYGMDYIEVNLSAVQCMQPRLYEELLGIMNFYDLPHSCINLEITETATVVSKETLLENMKQLIAAGLTFSLDDYGTGFSNLTTAIRYPFYLVKLDKSMLWSAMKDKNALLALKHTVSMLKDMKVHIVCEGVETLAQTELLTEIGCDYFQGFYYSRPVPKTEFLSLVCPQIK